MKRTTFIYFLLISNLSSFKIDFAGNKHLPKSLIDDINSAFLSDSYYKDVTQVGNKSLGSGTYGVVLQMIKNGQSIAVKIGDAGKIVPPLTGTHVERLSLRDRDISNTQNAERFLNYLNSENVPFIHKAYTERLAVLYHSSEKEFSLKSVWATEFGNLNSLKSLADQFRVQLYSLRSAEKPNFVKFIYKSIRVILYRLIYSLREVANRGIIQGDIKPHNIFMRTCRNPILDGSRFEEPEDTMKRLFSSKDDNFTNLCPIVGDWDLGFYRGAMPSMQIKYASLYRPPEMVFFSTQAIDLIQAPGIYNFSMKEDIFVTASSMIYVLKLIGLLVVETTKADADGSKLKSYSLDNDDSGLFDLLDKMVRPLSYLDIQNIDLDTVYSHEELMYNLPYEKYGFETPYFTDLANIRTYLDLINDNLQLNNYHTCAKFYKPKHIDDLVKKFKTDYPQYYREHFRYGTSESDMKKRDAMIGELAERKNMENLKKYYAVTACLNQWPQVKQDEAIKKAFRRKKYSSNFEENLKQADKHFAVYQELSIKIKQVNKGEDIARERPDFDDVIREMEDHFIASEDYRQFNFGGDASKVRKLFIDDVSRTEDDSNLQDTSPKDKEKLYLSTNFKIADIEEQVKLCKLLHINASDYPVLSEPEIIEKGAEDLTDATSKKLCELIYIKLARSKIVRDEIVRYNADKNRKIEEESKMLIDLDAQIKNEENKRMRAQKQKEAAEKQIVESHYNKNMNLNVAGIQNLQTIDPTTFKLDPKRHVVSGPVKAQHMMTDSITSYKGLIYGQKVVENNQIQPKDRNQKTPSVAAQNGQVPLPSSVLGLGALNIRAQIESTQTQQQRKMSEDIPETGGLNIQRETVANIPRDFNPKQSLSTARYSQINNQKRTAGISNIRQKPPIGSQNNQQVPFNVHHERNRSNFTKPQEMNQYPYLRKTLSDNFSDNYNAQHSFAAARDVYQAHIGRPHVGTDMYNYHKDFSFNVDRKYLRRLI